MCSLRRGLCRPARLWAVFKLSRKTNGGEVSIVEHPFEVGLITAAHRHTREDEHSFVLANAGTEPDRIVEIITPGGFENYFRELSELLGEHPNGSVGKSLRELPEFGQLADK
ncbi:MAG TPA: hypothetical protein VG327_15250 [Mycobacterium sp.]|nr:hypothetical protein [Mycobacterium sp.]